MKPTKQLTRAQKALDWMFTYPGLDITLVALFAALWVLTK